MAAPKKRSTKPTPRKRTVKKQPSTVAAAPPKGRSRKSEDQFMSAQFTEQTVFWIVIGVIVIFLVSWLMMIFAKTNQIYDGIDATSESSVIRN